MEVTVITKNDNLDALVSRINDASWDEANEISRYEAASLHAYLDRQDTVFVACHDTGSAPATFLGMASARIEHKPYDGSRWLYVDEIDVCADQRRRGVGRLIMEKLIQIAHDQDCEELWLATEDDNDAANALYRSLDPDDASNIVGYTYETD